MSEVGYSVYTHPESGAVWYQPDDEPVADDGLVMQDSTGLTKNAAAIRCDAIQEEWQQAAEKAKLKEAEEREQREALFRPFINEK